MSADSAILSWLRRLSLGKAILLAFLAGWVLHFPAAIVSYGRKGLLNDFEDARAVSTFIGHAAGISIIGFLVAAFILIFSRKRDGKGVVPAMTALGLCALLGVFVFAATAR